MSTSLEPGVDLIAHNLGSFQAGRAVLLTGAPGSGKTTFAIQFLWQGLEDGKPCVFVTGQAPSAVVAQASSLGMDLDPALKSGNLAIYEISRAKPYPFAELFAELEGVLPPGPAGRIAVEGLGLAAEPSADALHAFLPKLSRAGAGAVFALEPSAGNSPLRDSLENAAAASFLLSLSPDGKSQKLSVRKFEGASNAGGDFYFTIEPGRGIVEVQRQPSIKFPRRGAL